MPYAKKSKKSQTQSVLPATMRLGWCDSRRGRGDFDYLYRRSSGHPGIFVLALDGWMCGCGAIYASIPS